ncbi:MAG: winged helix-turn-helix transcriptional regulator [Ilumatobacteraceae bacterium]
MSEGPRDQGGEAIERTLRVIGDRWSILIVRAGLRGIRRFDDFCDDLGIARPILTARLRRLVEHGVMTKVPYQRNPVRYEYRLTEAGIALSPVLVALVRWSEDHGDGGGQTVSLVHAPCGTELEQAFWCRTCATTFGPTAIRGVDRRVPDGTSEALGDATEDAPTPEAGH